jgi:hypothetical protein
MHGMHSKLPSNNGRLSQNNQSTLAQEKMRDILTFFEKNATIVRIMGSCVDWALELGQT